jgi:acyl-coenzyme A synthetase/AMP-(fatty) acid ligase
MIARDDEHTALHEPQSGIRLSYAELHEAIADCAGRLAFVGVSAGDRVGLSFPNSVAFLVTFLAVVELGAAAAPLNGALGEREVAEELTDLAATRLLYAAENQGAASAARALGIPTNLISVVGNRIEVEHATGSPSPNHPTRSRSPCSFTRAGRRVGRRRFRSDSGT